jgi:hypothetical protein
MRPRWAQQSPAFVPGSGFRPVSSATYAPAVRCSGVIAGLAIAACAAVVVPVVPARGAGMFAPAEQFPTGSRMGPGPGAVTTIAADVDGDSDADVVATDWFGDGPLVLRNSGTGTFGAPEPIAGAADVGALATGDFDGDGRSDLAGRSASGVVALLGHGDGTFGVGDREAVSGNAQQSVAVFDADGDQRLDIVTPEQQGIRVLVGHGDGRFSAGPVSPLTGLLSDIKPANLDGDAALDLLVADATPIAQRVVALRGKGDGTFVESGSGATGYGPEGVIAGDLDGDGRDDAVSVDSFSFLHSLGSAFITVLLSDGAGGFRSSARYPTGQGPVSGIVADFDCDGALDVAISAVASSLVTVYLGNGTGRLTEAGRLPVVRQPQTPAAADFDRDGRTDLAVPGVGQLSFLRNTTAVDGGGSAMLPSCQTTQSS